MKRLTCLLAVATGVTGAAIAGCSAGEESRNLKGPKEFCLKYGAAMSSKLLSCSGTFAPEAVAQQATARALGSDSDCNMFAQLVAQGAVKFDSAKTAPCIEAVEKRGCARAINDLSKELGGPVEADRAGVDLYGILPTECAGVITGTKTVGAECSADMECMNGGECEGGIVPSSLVPSQCNPGKCVERVSLDGDCSGGKRCVKGLACVSNVCRAAPAENDPCGSVTGFSYCKDVFNNYCNDGSYGTVGTCLARKDLGAECTGSGLGYGDDDCKYELVCRFEDPVNRMGKKTCQTAGLKLDTACTVTSNVNCLLGLYCDEVCTLGADPDQPCGIINGRQVRCALGTCEQEDPLAVGVCKIATPEYLTSGETCPDQSPIGKLCAPGTYCIQSATGAVATCAACPP